MRKSQKSSDTYSDIETIENVFLRDMAGDRHFQPSFHTTVVADPKARPIEGFGHSENGIRKAVMVHSSQEASGEA